MSATLRTLLTHTRSYTAAGQRRVQGQPVHLLQPCSRPRPYVPLLSRWWLAHAHDARPAPFPHVCRAHTMLTRHYCVIAAGTVTATQRRVNPGLRMFGELTILGITTSTTLIIDPSVPYVRTPAAATNCSCLPPPPLPPPTAANRRRRHVGNRGGGWVPPLARCAAGHHFARRVLEAPRRKLYAFCLWRATRA